MEIFLENADINILHISLRFDKWTPALIPK